MYKLSVHKWNTHDYHSATPASTNAAFETPHPQLTHSQFHTYQVPSEYLQVSLKTTSINSPFTDGISITHMYKLNVHKCSAHKCHSATPVSTN